MQNLPKGVTYQCWKNAFYNLKTSKHRSNKPLVNRKIQLTHTQPKNRLLFKYSHWQGCRACRYNHVSQIFQNRTKHAVHLWDVSVEMQHPEIFFKILSFSVKFLVPQK